LIILFSLLYLKAEIRSASAEARSLLRLGRPDFGEIMEEMARIAASKGKSRVAVVTRGPVRFTDEVRLACLRHSINGVQFDFCVGPFEL
jgi:hypothetical protein